MVLSLVLAACGKPAPPVTPPPVTPPPGTQPPVTPPPVTPPPGTQPPVTPPPVSDTTPKYGGTLMLALPSDPTSWGPFPGSGATPITMQELWAGDWTLGNAGGYGTKDTDWSQTVDRFDRKFGLVAEKSTWSVDSATKTATIVYTIRQGIKYGLNPNSPASVLVNGRQLTADDVVFDMQQRISDTGSYVYLSNPELRTANITKTGPWEVTVKLPAQHLLTGINRLSSTSGYYPPEVFQKYNKMAGWRDQVGSAAWMLTDYVPGSLIVYSRNPNYWEKDPIGPGKGNQLPYLDKRQLLIIPDLSTRLAALRTGKLDTISSMSQTDAVPMMKQVPALKVLEKTSVDGRGTPVFPLVDRAPFNDVRVRRAMIYAIDYKSILTNYWGGKGQILTYPFADTKDYHDLYLGLDDADTPASVKDLFTYNPDKAKQLLKDAGFPNGIKTKLMLSTTDTNGIDYYSIIKDMWSKVGIDLSFDLSDPATYNNRQASRSYELTTGTTAPNATFYLGVAYQGTGQISNLGNLNDPTVNAALDEVRATAVTDLPAAMKVWREKLAKYVLDQAFAIPNVIGYNYNLWWPWLGGYSGEGPTSYAQTIWPNYIWYDSALKKSMGY
jgi:peptide/nickel transport system substrate-binding protein